MRRLKRAAFAAGLAIMLFSYPAASAEAKGLRQVKLEEVKGDPFKEPVKIRCTCYCEKGKTATGKKTRYGIVAGKKEWLGYTLEINAVKEDGSMGELIGLFEFQDTGAGMDTDGDGKGDSIINGQSIDVCVGSLSDAYEWRDTYGDYIYMKIIKSDG